MHSIYQMRNFLRACQDGRVTQYDNTVLMAWADGSYEDVKPLMTWALDNELVNGDWHPQHSADSASVALTEAGELQLAELSKPN